MSNQTSKGFTLIELLVVIAILAVLAALAFPVLAKARESGTQAAEVSAARKLMAGMHSYSADNGGQIMPAIASRGNAGEVRDAAGDPVSGQAALRYAWRLAPYIGYDVDDTLLASKPEIEDKTDPYMVSLVTSFGINAVYVGGDFGGPLSPDNPRAISRLGSFCVTRAVQAVQPSKLIVFASAYYNDSRIGGRQPGYHKVEAPDVNVDFRHNERALVACLDGHAEFLTRNQMKDMRRWSNLAAAADDPNKTLR